MSATYASNVHSTDILSRPNVIWRSRSDPARRADRPAHLTPDGDLTDGLAPVSRRRCTGGRRPSTSGIIAFVLALFAAGSRRGRIGAAQERAKFPGAFRLRVLVACLRCNAVACNYRIELAKT